MTPITSTLDLDALRSFVVGIECGSFAQAAARLHRSTSAVSVHVKKLEQQCQAQLVKKQGRHLVLTPSGERLMGYAKRLLAVNDEALMSLRGALLQGSVQLGLQEDFGESFIPPVLGQFAKAHGGVQVTAHIARNQVLIEATESGEMDLALIWCQQPPHNAFTPLKSLPLRWISTPDFPLSDYLQRGEPVPLVMFDSPCLFRKCATDALDAAGIAWRVAFVSQSLGGIWAAVNAGLGITVRSAIGVPGLLTSTLSAQLPALPSMGIGLIQRQPKPSEVVEQLKQLLLLELERQL